MCPRALYITMYTIPLVRIIWLILDFMWSEESVGFTIMFIYFLRNNYFDRKSRAGVLFQRAFFDRKLVQDSIFQRSIFDFLGSFLKHKENQSYLKGKFLLTEI